MEPSSGFCAGAFEVYDQKGNTSVSKQVPCSSSCVGHKHYEAKKGLDTVGKAIADSLWDKNRL